MSTDFEAIHKKIQEDNRSWKELSHKEISEIEFKFKRSLMQLIFNFPFFGFMAAKIANDVVWIKTPEQARTMAFRTMATDGKRVYIWPQYVLYHDIPVVMGTIMHELMHVILLHISRGVGYNPQLSNIAMDHVVNMMVNDLAKEVQGENKKTGLSPALYDKLPWYIPCPPGYHNEQYRDANGDPWVWERVYEDLLAKQNPDTQKMLRSGETVSDLAGVDSNGRLQDDHSVWSPSKPKMDEDGNPITGKFDPSEAIDMVRDAYVQTTQSKMKGTLPASMERMINEWLHPPLPWQRLVQRWLKPVPGDFGYQPGDLRFADPMPWFIPEQKLEYIVISIDTSGSMSDQEVGTAITQARHLLKSFPQTKGILCMCDAAVSLWQPIEEAYTIQRRVGYGGTSFHPPFEKIIEEGLQDKVCVHIYFTDGYGNFPDDDWLKQHQLRFDTLWVITNNDVTPPASRQSQWTRLNPITGAQR